MNELYVYILYVIPGLNRNRVFTKPCYVDSVSPFKLYKSEFMRMVGMAQYVLLEYCKTRFIYL